LAKADRPLPNPVNRPAGQLAARERQPKQSFAAERFYHPGFNLVRVVAALAVVFSHSFAVYTGTEDQEPFQQATGEILGIYAVLVFFLLSGILITDSALNTPSPWHFAIKRARRILPAFVASNLLVVLAICPFFAKDGAQDFLTDPQTWKTLLRVLTFQDAALRFNSVEFAHETGAGYPGLWNLANGVLWTIRIELVCYVLVGVMAALRLLRPIPVLVLFALSYIALMKSALPATPFFGTLVFLLPSFAVGMYLRINVCGHVAQGYLALSSLVTLVLSMFLMHGWVRLEGVLFPLFFAYPLLWLGQQGRTGTLMGSDWNDPSYGIYIWGWPVQQVLASAIGPGLSPYVFAALCLLVVGFVGYVSWFVIERPFLRRKTRLPIAESGS